MLSEQTILRIQELLGQNGPTHSQIAAECGVSRSLVSKVANGKRTLDTCYQPSEPEPEKPEIYARCPSCGRRVLMPCLACSLQKMVSHPSNEQPEKLIVGLNLSPEHHKRYLQVRAEREKHGIS